MIYFRVPMETTSCDSPKNKHSTLRRISLTDFFNHLRRELYQNHLIRLSAGNGYAIVSLCATVQWHPLSQNHYSSCNRETFSLPHYIT